MDKIFIVIRKLHLYASFVIASFLFMYFLSVQLHDNGYIFPRKNVKTLSKVARKIIRQMRKLLMKFPNYTTFMVRRPGVRVPVLTYNYYRPGYRAGIIFVEGTDSIKVNIAEGTFWSAME